MKINIGLFGGSGKMGRAVEQMLPQMKFAAEARAFLFVGSGESSLFSICANNLDGIEDDVLAAVDVWIEFSSEDGLIDLLKRTEKFKTPIVSGATGLTDKTFSLLAAQAKKRKIFWSSNMSPGLWAFRQALKGLQSISHFDFALEEIHHTQKKDNPSGTAKTIQKDLEAIAGKKIQMPEGLRLGGVFGIHKVLAVSSNEMISVEHQALNRTVFAEGALLAAHWLVKQKKSKLYSMDDMFGTNKRRQK
jgi:4-hydroxy-tetrahydrodipicolinate reductase